MGRECTTRESEDLPLPLRLHNFRVKSTLMKKTPYLHFSRDQWAWGILACVSLVCLSCGPSPSDEDEATTTVSEVSEKSPSAYSLDYAQNFEIFEEDGFRKLVIRRSQTDPSDSIVYYVVSRDRPAPEGIPQERLIRTPIQRLVTMSTTHVALADALGVSESIVGNANNQFVTSGKLLERIAEGKVEDIGNDQALRMEQILALEPDMVMVYSVGPGEYKKYQALLASGIPIVMNSEWLEGNPLGRAEWLKCLALFYEMEAEAEDIFSQIVHQYDSLKALVGDPSNKPSVLCGLPYRGTWYVPRGGSFVGQLISDAGGDYFWKSEPGTGSLPLDFESVYAEAVDAQVWINVGQVRNRGEIAQIDSRLLDFAPFQTKRVYNHNKIRNKNGGNDYYMSSVVQPQWVLADLIKIFHPDLLPNYTSTYYQAVN